MPLSTLSILSDAVRDHRATNGRKDRPPAITADLNEPHILRSLCNVKITKIVTGPSANYAIVIDSSFFHPSL